MTTRIGSYPNCGLAIYDQKTEKYIYQLPKKDSLVLRATKVVIFSLICGAVGLLLAHYGAGAHWVNTIGATAGGMAFGAAIGILAVQRIQKYKKSERASIKAERKQWDLLTFQQQQAHKDARREAFAKKAQELENQRLERQIHGSHCDHDDR